MFNRLERDLRGQGKRDLADTTKALHKLNGADIPLPGKEGANIIQFSAEQRKSLEHKGYVIYALTGKSIASLRDAGHPFRSTWHKGESFETLASLRTEVAINPNRLFLPKSNGKTLNEQVTMVAEFGKKIGSEVAGTTAILGSVADYAEVAFAHLDQKGQRLFGKNFDYDYARTTTPAGGSHDAVVGRFVVGNGLDVDILHRGVGFSDVWAAPLVVPTSAVGR